MALCDKCGKEVALPFKCSYCGGAFCGEHRLPENHDCKAPAAAGPSEKEGNHQDLVPDIQEGEPSKSFQIRYDFDTSRPLERPSTPRVRLFPMVSMAILVLIALVFVVQFVAEFVLGSAYYSPGDHSSFIYYLATSRATLIERPWTLVTSVFAHGGFLHIFFNGMVFLSFGPVLEARIGGKKFLMLFLGSGILAGLAQLAFTEPEAVLLGASGAILGVLGALTVFAPQLPVLLFFFVPLKLWMATIGFGILSVVLAVLEVGGSIANVAHFAGLIIGLAYGYKLKRDERRKQGDILKKMFGPLFEARA